MYLQMYRVRINIFWKFKSKEINIYVGCIYCHPQIDLGEFNECYFNSLLNRLTKENKTIFV